MSDAPDKESKTELPTERRVSDAVEKGNVPQSREAVTLGSMLAIVAVLLLVMQSAVPAMVAPLALLLGQAEQWDVTSPAGAAFLMRDVFGSVFGVLVVPVIILALGSVLGALLQNVPQATLERLVPKWERISPAANFGRIFGKAAWLEFAKIVVKSVAVGFICWHVFKTAVDQQLFTYGLQPAGLPHVLQDMATRVLAPLALVAFLIAIADLVYVRLKWTRDLMMTRQEVKDELRQSEGDPMVKQRIKMLAQRRVRNRMMAELPKATVVVVNPTHYAVAMRYVAAEGGAPLILAKGVDHLALRIRETCEELKVPVVENKLLARALYQVGEVGQMIPPEYYRAVAEVIHYIEMRRRLSQPRRGTP